MVSLLLNFKVPSDRLFIIELVVRKGWYAECLGGGITRVHSPPALNSFQVALDSKEGINLT